MFTRKWIASLFAGLLVIVVSLSLPNLVSAEGDAPETPSNCIGCHEKLYYLHDTGKYFCVNEASQRCTDCHSGDPAATDKEAAHSGRSAHPVVNGDISKCQECHPTDCDTYIEKFSQVAGIKPVFVAMKPDLLSGQPAKITVARSISTPDALTVLIPILAGGALIVLALVAFIIHLRHHA